MEALTVADIPGLAASDLPQERWDDWFLTRLGSAVDGAMLQAMRFVVDATLMPRPADLPVLRASAERFVIGDLWEDPRRFFAFVDEPVAPLAVSSDYRRSVTGGAIFTREFATAYEPYHPDEAAVRAEALSQDKVLVEHWVHESEAPLGTVLALHGFSMGYPRIDAIALFAAQCFRAGLDVALLTLPFHGPRTPADARFSGERFAVPHVAHLNDAVRQAIYEIHVVSGWLRRQREAPIGLLGLSLGGYLASLMAGLTADLDFVIPMVPPACMGDLAWRFFSHSRRYRSAASPAFSREELRAAYRVHSPLSYPRRVDKRRILILAGRGDQIVPPEHPHALWRHWEEPEIYWFSGSHLAPFRRGRLARVLLQHIERCSV